MQHNSVDIQIQNVKKAFPSYGGAKEFYAVNGIDLSINPGELVTLLGPSGCGKTTTLRMLAGFEIPTEGNIIIGGKDVTNIPPNKRNIGMMFQSYALFPHLDVYDNIAYGLIIQRRPKKEIDQRVHEMAELMQISDYVDRMPNEISGGQQQRVALARAIIGEPQVLLFDEPLSNLDAKLREYMRDELRKIQKNVGITSMYVTHDQSEAMAISDRVVIMKAGKIEQQGTSKDIYSNPINSFVANFMGKANFVKVETFSKQTSSDIALATILGKTMPIKFASGFEGGVCLIRPEDISFDSEGELEARVVRSSYFGSSIEYELVMPTGEHLVKTESADTEHIHAEGSAVKVRFATKRLRLLPETR